MNKPQNDPTVGCRNQCIDFCLTESLQERVAELQARMRGLEISNAITTNSWKAETREVINLQAQLERYKAMSTTSDTSAIREIEARVLEEAINIATEIAANTHEQWPDEFDQGYAQGVGAVINQIRALAKDRREGK